LLFTFLSGLGGEVVRVTDFYAMAASLQEAVAAQGGGQRVYWLGFEPLQAGGRLQ
jgi:hypothetical protein